MSCLSLSSNGARLKRVISETFNSSMILTIMIYFPLRSTLIKRDQFRICAVLFLQYFSSARRLSLFPVYRSRYSSRSFRSQIYAASIDSRRAHQPWRFTVIAGGQVNFHCLRLVHRRRQHKKCQQQERNIHHWRHIDTDADAAFLFL